MEFLSFKKNKKGGRQKKEGIVSEVEHVKSFTKIPLGKKSHRYLKSDCISSIHALDISIVSPYIYNMFRYCWITPNQDNKC